MLLGAYLLGDVLLHNSGELLDRNVSIERMAEADGRDIEKCVCVWRHILVCGEYVYSSRQQFFGDAYSWHRQQWHVLCINLEAGWGYWLDQVLVPLVLLLRHLVGVDGSGHKVVVLWTVPYALAYNPLQILHSLLPWPNR